MIISIFKRKEKLFTFSILRFSVLFFLIFYFLLFVIVIIFSFFLVKLLCQKHIFRKIMKKNRALRGLQSSNSLSWKSSFDSFNYGFLFCLIIFFIKTFVKIGQVDVFNFPKYLQLVLLLIKKKTSTILYFQSFWQNNTISFGYYF